MKPSSHKHLSKCPGYNYPVAYKMLEQLRWQDRIEEFQNMSDRQTQESRLSYTGPSVNIISSQLILQYKSLPPNHSNLGSQSQVSKRPVLSPTALSILLHFTTHFVWVLFQEKPLRQRHSCMLYGAKAVASGISPHCRIHSLPD